MIKVQTEVRLAIIEDHPIFRTGLIQLIESERDLKVVGEADNAWDGKALILKEKPDLVIVDISLKDSSGLEMIKSVVQERPGTRILVVSMHDEGFYAERAIHAGAKGYVMKQEAPTRIIEAIRTLLRGRIFLSDQMKDQLLERMVSSPDKDSVSSVNDLSDRELSVFELIGLGFGSSEIAERLHLSVKTIETHKDHIKIKLNLKNARELTQFAIQWKITQKG